MAAQTPYGREDGGHRRCDSTDTERNHDDVPGGPVVVQEREIKTMQPVVQPSLGSAHALFLLNDHTTIWIEVQRRVGGIAVPDPKYREWQPRIAIVVVRVVTIESDRRANGSMRNRRASRGGHRLLLATPTGPRVG